MLSYDFLSSVEQPARISAAAVVIAAARLAVVIRHPFQLCRCVARACPAQVTGRESTGERKATRGYSGAESGPSTWHCGAISAMPIHPPHPRPVDTYVAPGRYGVRTSAGVAPLPWLHCTGEALS